MNWLREKIKGKEKFYKVLAFAICINVLLVGVLAAVSVCFKDITVSVNGKTATYITTADTVDALLKGWDVSLEEKDKVKPGLQSRIEDGDEIDIRLHEEKKEVVEKELPYKTVEEYTSELMEGEKKVKTKGVKGKEEITYKITYLGGEEQDRKIVKKETVKKPVDCVMLVGTAFAYNGERYSRKITVTATGYTHTGNRTATGTYPKRGTMAVDRSVIPMGSYGYVPGYGPVHAEDTGGAVRGNIIDLFFETRGEAISWGRRTVELYLK